MARRRAVYGEEKWAIFSFAAHMGSKKTGQRQSNDEKWAMAREGVDIIYFPDSKKLLFLGAEKRANWLNGTYKTFIQATQKKPMRESRHWAGRKKALE